MQDKETVELLARLDERSKDTSEDIKEIKLSINDITKVVSELPCDIHKAQISILFKITFTLLTLNLCQALTIVYTLFEG